ncbi:MAG: hypothetical protein WCO71_12575, partial [Pseudomonadota bacterium]
RWTNSEIYILNNYEILERQMTRLFKNLSTLAAAGAGVCLIIWAGNGYAADSPSWDAKLAAKYLDDREVEWQEWDRPHTNSATLCVSCHTQAAYGLARPILHKMTGDETQTPAEKAMLASVIKRVMNWSKMQPVYTDIIFGPGKEIEAYNSEAVLNAIILTGYDKSAGHMAEATHKAFENAWALQSTSGTDAGSWVPQLFNLAPFETPESRYYFAALFAVAVGNAPDNYRADPKISKNLDLLTTYLRSHFESQPLLNKIVALWATHTFPSILDKSQRATLSQQVDHVQKADGGWSLTDLGPWGKRRDGSPFETRSDGFATGLIALVARESAPELNKKNTSRALGWLRSNQDKKTGAWTAWSLNTVRDPASMTGKFMNDTATAFAVLALSESH